MKRQRDTRPRESLSLCLIYPTLMPKRRHHFVTAHGVFFKAAILLPVYQEAPARSDDQASLSREPVAIDPFVNRLRMTAQLLGELCDGEQLRIIHLPRIFLPLPIPVAQAWHYSSDATCPARRRPP